MPICRAALRSDASVQPFSVIYALLRRQLLLLLSTRRLDCGIKSKLAAAPVIDQVLKASLAVFMGADTASSLQSTTPPPPKIADPALTANNSGTVETSWWPQTA